jgi:hypothetical protein
METAVITIHVFIEIDRHHQAKLEFHSAEVTGRQIKEKAGVPIDDDLALRDGQKLQLITNEQVIKLKNGQHFVALPQGTVS